MQAIILAAGMGKRLKELTANNTKCMVKVNGVTLAERLLRQLDKKKLSRIVVVAGYESGKLIDYIGSLGIATKIEFVENTIYDKTNNIYSLYLARDYLLKEDTLLFESDLIFEESVIDALLDDERQTLALVDKYESWMDGTCVKLSDDDSITEFVPGKKFNFTDREKYFKTVNIYKFSREFSETHYVPFLEAYSQALGNNEYYEQVLRVIAMLDNPMIKAKRLSGQKWYEIDDEADLDIAESIFADEDLQLQKIQSRYGGYWRYPKMLDFCYLVNPYFPPQKMLDEIQSNFSTLLTQYPSGMKVNSLLAAKNFGVHAENIVVGNGAAELIKSLMREFSGATGFVRPTFEEYPNRYDSAQEVVFCPQNENFSYSADSLIKYFGEHKVQNLVLINPDNPSGNYIRHENVMQLIEWTRQTKINFVIDESFADFAEETDNTFFVQKLLEENPHVFVVKSISKSFGVPGLRLGVLASGNTEFISRMKKDVAIWNINSFAEFYMQIYEKYKKDYAVALEKFRAERKRFAAELAKIKNVRVVPSEANYFMLELYGTNATEITKKLLRDNVFIKDLSGKIKDADRQFVRVAIRNTEDNNVLVGALQKYTGGVF